jgi:hypothetical protein
LRQTTGFGNGHSAGIKLKKARKLEGLFLARRRLRRVFE